MRPHGQTGGWWRLLAWCALLLVGACGADDETAPTYPPDTRRQIETVIDDEMATRNLPGVVVGVWQAGFAPYVVARGQADLATGRARAADDPFRIASITKSFIGTAVLLLVDRGQLALTDTLDRWYPAFPNARLITVDHLLRMRSGIADSADKAFLAEYHADPLIALDAEAMIARSAARRAEFIAPDTVTRYINVNFILLERIVEKTAGTDIRTFLRRNVFDPLGLAHTLYPTDSTLPGALRGYSLDAASGRQVDRTVLNPLPAGGAGALISTLDDLHVWGRALCAGGLLSPALQAARQVPTHLEDEPAFVGYGIGLARLGRFCGHNGTIFGFSSELWVLPERDAVIVVSVNRLDLNDASQSFAVFARVARVPVSRPGGLVAAACLTARDLPRLTPKKARR